MLFRSGYPAIIIEGHPHNYCKHGFVGSKSVNVCGEDGRFHYSMLVLELTSGVLSGNKWVYLQSQAYCIDREEAENFDRSFPLKQKHWKPSQEEYRIALNAWILDE